MLPPRPRTVAGTGTAGATLRDLAQDIYLQDLVLSMYRVYVARLRDAEGRRLLETYIRQEEDRGRRLARHLIGRGGSATPTLRASFAAAGRLYGRVTSWLGTRVMLRIVLSASRKASRRACALADAAMQDAPSEQQYFASIRARNESDLRDDLTQHLIDTR
jgi:hypothetical protein